MTGAWRAEDPPGGSWGDGGAGPPGKEQGMKALAMAAMLLAAAGPAAAALSGFYDSGEQIGAILESADVADRLRQAPLWRIENTGSREADGAQQWTVSTQRCDLIVWLVPEPPAAGMVGKTGYRVELGSGCE